MISGKKLALCLFFKKCKMEDPGSCRPVSLASVPGKNHGACSLKTNFQACEGQESN